MVILESLHHDQPSLTFKNPPVAKMALTEPSRVLPEDVDDARAQWEFVRSTMGTTRVLAPLLPVHDVEVYVPQPSRRQNTRQHASTKKRKRGPGRPRREIRRTPRISPKAQVDPAQLPPPDQANYTSQRRGGDKVWEASRVPFEVVEWLNTREALEIREECLMNALHESGYSLTGAQEWLQQKRQKQLERQQHSLGVLSMDIPRAREWRYRDFLDDIRPIFKNAPPDPQDWDKDSLPSEDSEASINDSENRILSPHHRNTDYSSNGKGDDDDDDDDDDDSNW